MDPPRRAQPAAHQPPDGEAAILDPGWVRTDMGGPEAPLTPARSVAGMMTVIDGLTARDSGRFYTWEGTAAPW